MSARPSLLFYCQHSLGMGHLVRSLALASALATDFDVTLLNGGRMPPGAVVAGGIDVVNLSPLGHDDAYQLVSHDPSVDVDSAMARRLATIVDVVQRTRPAVIFVELYPFGRKKFAFELDPLLDQAAAMGHARPAVVCSLRDILVNDRRDQARHDQRAAEKVNAHFDAVLVHADPAFATLEESFRPATPLRVPVYHTGFVAPPAVQAPADADRHPRVLVSAGGGMVGEALFRAAVGAAAEIRAHTGLRTHIVAGPFLPEPVWAWLERQAGPDVEVVRQVDDLAAEMASSAVSVSQCGYNTTMDLLRARTPAVVVPYAAGREDEQRRRADRLQALGVMTVVPAAELDPARLAHAVRRQLHAPVPAVRLDLDGARATAAITARLAGLCPEPVLV